MDLGDRLSAQYEAENDRLIDEMYDTRPEIPDADVDFADVEEEDVAL